MNLSYLSMRKAVIIALTGFVPVLALAQAITPRDTVNVRNSHNMRQALYETNQDPFAPPRKNNWSIGIQTGNVMLTGDVDPQRGLGVGLNIRKALGHTVSLRLQGSTGTTRGLNWRANGGYFFNRGLNGFNNPDANYLTAAYPYVFYNYKMRFWESNLQMVFNIGNINFYKSMPKVGLYTFAGVGGMLYRTQIDALDADGNICLTAITRPMLNSMNTSPKSGIALSFPMPPLDLALRCVFHAVWTLPLSTVRPGQAKTFWMDSAGKRPAPSLPTATSFTSPRSASISRSARAKSPTGGKTRSTAFTAMCVT
jgi:hypothetical protein